MGYGGKKGIPRLWSAGIVKNKSGDRLYSDDGLFKDIDCEDPRNIQREDKLLCHAFSDFYRTNTRYPTKKKMLPG